MPVGLVVCSDGLGKLTAHRDSIGAIAAALKPEGEQDSIVQHYIRSDLHEAAQKRIQALEAVADAWYTLAREASNSPLLAHGLEARWWDDYNKALALRAALEPGEKE